MKKKKKKSTVIFCNDYPKPITQTLISTSAPVWLAALISRNEGAISGKITEKNTHTLSPITLTQPITIMLSYKKKNKWSNKVYQ